MRGLKFLQSFGQRADCVMKRSRLLWHALRFIPKSFIVYVTLRYVRVPDSGAGPGSTRPRFSGRLVQLRSVQSDLISILLLLQHISLTRDHTPRYHPRRALARKSRRLTDSRPVSHSVSHHRSRPVACLGYSTVYMSCVAGAITDDQRDRRSFWSVEHPPTNLLMPALHKVGRYVTFQGSFNTILHVLYTFTDR